LEAFALSSRRPALSPGNFSGDTCSGAGRGELAVLSAGFFLDIAVTLSRASPAPTGFVVCIDHPHDINPVGAKFARDAFSA
jgi:hypothetical protein